MHLSEEGSIKNKEKKTAAEYTACLAGSPGKLN